MVERIQFPIQLSMTLFTGSTECAFMLIVFLVAGVTGPAPC